MTDSAVSIRAWNQVQPHSDLAQTLDFDPYNFYNAQVFVKSV
jgi:hypothetical protein